MSDGRARKLAELASGLAAAADVTLPGSLRLWHLAGDHPSAAPRASEDPAGELGRALEAALDEGERRRGAHHTPVALADRVATLAGCREATAPGGQRLGETGNAGSDRCGPTVVDPACGGGALLLAAGRQLVEAGLPPDVVARDLLWGADISPLAAAVTEVAIALWSGGTAPAPGHVVVADTLAAGLQTWPIAPTPGFDVLVGNPPFQGQLGRDTARSKTETAALRSRFGDAVAPYVDTAALFLLIGSELVRGGGSMSMVLPQSIVAARDAAPVRVALAERARLHELWVPERRSFEANVHICIAAFEIVERRSAGESFRRAERSGCEGTFDGGTEGAAVVAPDPVDWAGRLATARGVPRLDLEAHDGSLGDVASAVAGFRDEYYGLVGHVREAGEDGSIFEDDDRRLGRIGDAEVVAPLITSGCIDPGACRWGERPVRFAKQQWQRPVVDLAVLRADDPKLSAWVQRLRRPKVVVASQTRVLEAAVDREGTWVPVTPLISVIPTKAADAPRLAAALCSPPVSVWAARRAAGTAMSSTAIRVSAALVLAAPLPLDRAAWDDATDALANHDLERFAEAATAMYRLASPIAKDVRAWWTARVPT